MNGLNQKERTGGNGGQTVENESVNARFFNSWTEYHALVENLDTYRHTARALEGELHGRVVDVGSGGIINYSCSEISELVLVDLGTEFRKHLKLPSCAVPTPGSAVALPLSDGSYDCLLMQMLLHHLAETDYPTSRDRVLTALREAHRVLKPGGKIVLVESVVCGFLETAQRISFGITKQALKAMGHPLVFQWTARSLCNFVEEVGFTGAGATDIPLGRWIIFLGRCWPTMLCPVNITKIVAKKA